MAAPTMRPARDSDLGQVVAIYNHYIEHTSTSFDLEPYTEETRRTWFEQFVDSGRYRMLVMEDPAEQRLLGYACSTMFRKKAAYRSSVETSIYLRHGTAGRGLGSQLYGALFEVLSQEDVHRAYAGITLPNEPSIKLHEKFGFALAGVFREIGFKFDRYWNVAWYEKELH